jgi:hypothetical protein
VREGVLMSDHICTHCGLPAKPHAYHEGAGDCVAALKREVERLRAALPAKTADDVRAALAALRSAAGCRLFASSDEPTRRSIVGTVAALKWVLGDGDDGPVQASLGFIAEIRASMAAGSERN